MAIFQPVYVTPDVRAGIGLGTVDVTDPNGMVVSWRITGPSGMVAYQITIYTNDSASTQKYTTGKVTLGSPAYGTTSTGAVQMFSHTISAATLSSASITNGGSYKLIIKQWWGATDTQSVTQSSASAFITRKAPSVGIATIGTAGVVSTRYYTFTGNYTQEQGDVLNWFRWQIAYSNNLDSPIYDSGEITGTMDLQCYFDGLFNGSNYSVKLSLQTENGIEADSGWVDFAVNYGTSPVTGSLTAVCVRGTNAVKVSWNDLADVPGTPSGNAYINDNGQLVLDSDSGVVWDEANGSAMSFSAPWSIVWRGKLIGKNATIFTVAQTGGNITLSYAFHTGTLTLKKGATTVATQTGIINSPTVTVVLTDTDLYIRAEYLDGGLYPGSTLYPGTSLYPITNDLPTVAKFTVPVSYTQETITSVALDGTQDCYYMEVINGVASADVITEAYDNGTYAPGLSGGDYMLTDFANNAFNAGNLNVGGETISGFALYRRDSGTNILRHVGDTDADQRVLYDYGVRSQQGPYTYYLFPVSDTSYISTQVVSNDVTPCFWDWSIMECQETDQSGIYTVLQEFRFGKNLSSGSMSNNSKPEVLANFTPYPTVQLSSQNYRSGTLNSLIGYIDYTGGRGYSDTLALRDLIFALSSTTNPLFLKSRKGDLLQIRVSDAISMTTDDKTREQTQTVSVSWVEVADASAVSLYAVADMAVGSDTYINNGEAPAPVPPTQTVFTPYVSPNGVLTWTSNDGSPVPQPLDLHQYVSVLISPAAGSYY